MRLSVSFKNQIFLQLWSQNILAQSESFPANLENVNLTSICQTVQSSDLFVFSTLPQKGCFIVEVALKPNVLSSEG
jgi:hypothetical protein